MDAFTVRSTGTIHHLLRFGTESPLLVCVHLSNPRLQFRPFHLSSHSQMSTSAVALLSQQNIDHFAYDSSERILFILDNLTRELRLYGTINCDGSSRLRMHSWSIDHLMDSIHGMEIDILHGQLIFASNDQFLVANISTPNITRVIFTSDRPIMRFIYGIDHRIETKMRVRRFLSLRC